MPADVIASDLAKFFNSEDFASVATRVGGATINVVASIRYFGAEDGVAEVQTQPLELLARAADNVLDGEQLTIGGVTYEIVHREQNIDTVRCLARPV